MSACRLCGLGLAGAHVVVLGCLGLQSGCAKGGTVQGAGDETTTASSTTNTASASGDTSTGTGSTMDDGSATGPDGTGSDSTGTTAPDCQLALSFDFSSCDSGWTHGKAYPASAASSWECGDPTGFTLGPGTERTGVWGTNLSGSYHESESSYLLSPEFSLADCEGAPIQATIEHWYNFEGGATNADGGIIQINADGLLWNVVQPEAGGYYTVTPITASHPPVDGRFGFSALELNKTWRTTTIDLSPFAGAETVVLRLVFGSDDTNPRGGWYVDQVDIGIGGE